jgi:glutamine amidotransferase
MIGIVDYGMGNLRSLKNALEHVGLDAEVVDGPTRLGELDRLILPGVGAFGRAMENLRERRLVEALRAFAASGRPLLGICLGMQLLASRSAEFGNHEGLGIIDGDVTMLANTRDFPTPHVGWNTMRVVGHHAYVASVRKVVDYYFVHSLHFAPRRAQDVLATTTYGETFASVVGRDNVVGCQFHPEKSQVGGLALLERFGEWDGTP